MPIVSKRCPASSTKEKVWRAVPPPPARAKGEKKEKDLAPSRLSLPDPSGLDTARDEVGWEEEKRKGKKGLARSWRKRFPFCLSLPIRTTTETDEGEGEKKKSGETPLHAAVAGLAQAGAP